MCVYKREREREGGGERSNTCNVIEVIPGSLWSDSNHSVQANLLSNTPSQTCMGEPKMLKKCKRETLKL